MRRSQMISCLTKQELEYVRDNANFTDEQAAIFDALNLGRYYDAGIMHALGISNRRYYDLKKIVIHKVERLMRDIHT